MSLKMVCVIGNRNGKSNGAGVGAKGNSSTLKPGDYFYTGSYQETLDIVKAWGTPKK